METPRLTLLYSNPLLASALERAIAPDGPLKTLPWPSAQAEMTLVLSQDPPQVLVLQGGSSLPIPPQEIASMVKTTRPSVKVVAVLEDWTEAALLAVLEAGADAALSHRAGVEQFKAAVDSVLHGDSYLSPDLSRVLFDWLQRRPLRQRQREYLANALNAQQIRILAALAEGKRDREIAEAMFLSPKTVRNNVSIILQRLRCRDRSEAAVYATAAGLTDMREAERLLLSTS
jgi:DNA-binding NarL/FixJ family response regulator